ncbi:MAG: hypothetical protein QOG87_1033 [Actinomycetota bacterium]|jgi:hypothetical protein
MATTPAHGGSHPLRQEIRLLLQVAMVVFVWTVGIGILNGTDLVDFNRKVVLSHVHVGTLGWITMCVFAASLWLFGADAGDDDVTMARVLARVAVVSLPLFAFTFAVTYEEARPILGSVALLTIVGFFVWVVRRVRAVEMTVVHLGFLAAVTTSVLGGTIGVLLATRIATGRDVVPVGAEDAHPATMVVGFLIPVGMALAEWALGWPTLRAAGRAGRWQIALPFAGGVVLMIGLLFDIEPLPPMAALIELVGVVLFARRMWPLVRAVDWMASAPARFGAVSAIAVVVNILFLNYLIGANGGDVDKIATRQILAVDHLMFVGVLTNGIFGLLRGITSGDDRWETADHVVFYGMNLGLLGFVVALLADNIGIEQVATPVLGASILLGLGLTVARFARGVAIAAPSLSGPAASPAGRPAR